MDFKDFVPRDGLQHRLSLFSNVCSTNSIVARANQGSSGEARTIKKRLFVLHKPIYLAQIDPG